MSDTYGFRCRDAGVICRTEVRGSSEEEVLGKAIEHARKAHGVDLTLSRTLQRYARAAITHPSESGSR